VLCGQLLSCATAISRFILRPFQPDVQGVH
jgi:hypothetical protein